MSWGVVYYRDSDGEVPGEVFLDACPSKVEATILAVLEAIRAAPPPRFSGGGEWEAMHGAWAGTTRSASQARVDAITDCSADLRMARRRSWRRGGFDRPQIVVITGLSKQNRAVSRTPNTRDKSVFSATTT